MSQVDVYQAVTEKVMAALEEGTVPWRKPWSDAGLPVNIRTKRAYRGINVFLLGMQPYGDPRWGTFKAIKDAGGFVRKGEHGTWIVLWKEVTKRQAEEGDEPESYRLLRFYKVFNAEQCAELPPLEVTEEREHTPLQACEAIVEGYSPGPGILFGGGRASYSITNDLVRMPRPEQFHTVEGYYSTLFHELTHSTGHEKRLDRLEPALFGTDPYSREELVAEFGAAMLRGVAGIDGSDELEQSAAYIANWLERLSNDKKLAVTAAAQAQRAIDLILGTTFEDTTTKEGKELVTA